MTHEFFSFVKSTHEDVSKMRFAKGQRNWFGFGNNYIVIIIVVIVITIVIVEIDL